MSVSCSICDRKLANIESLAFHTSTFHPRNNRDDDDGLCGGEKVPDDQISNRADRTSVWSSPHTAWYWPFRCPTCGRLFKSKASLSTHKSRFHAKRDTVDRQSEEGDERSSDTKKIDQNELDESSQVHTLVPTDSDNTRALGPGQSTIEPCSTSRTITRERSLFGRRKRRGIPTKKRKPNETNNSDRHTQAKRIPLAGEGPNNCSDINRANIELDRQTCEHPTVVTPTLMQTCEHPTAVTPMLSMLASYKIKRELFENLVPRVFTTEQYMKSTMSEEQLLLIDAVLSVYNLSEIRRLLNENRELLLGIINHIETAIFMDN